MLYSKIPSLPIIISGSEICPDQSRYLIRQHKIIEIRGNNEYSIWDIVSENYKKPEVVKTEKGELSKKVTNSSIEQQNWVWEDDFAEPTIAQNCNQHVQTRIDRAGTAKKAYNKLKTTFEGKIVTEFCILLASISNHHFKDRKTPIEEHIISYEKSWNAFSLVIRKADLASNNRFGEALVPLLKSNKAKTEFFLRSLSLYYINTGKNIQSKDHSYDNTIRKL